MVTLVLYNFFLINTVNIAKKKKKRKNRKKENAFGAQAQIRKWKYVSDTWVWGYLPCGPRRNLIWVLSVDPDADMAQIQKGGKTLDRTQCFRSGPSGIQWPFFIPVCALTIKSHGKEGFCHPLNERWMYGSAQHFKYTIKPTYGSYSGLSRPGPKFNMGEDHGPYPNIQGRHLFRYLIIQVFIDPPSFLLMLWLSKAIARKPFTMLLMEDGVSTTF